MFVNSFATGSKAVFKDSAYTVLSNGVADPPGSLTFTSMDVTSNGELQIGTDSHVQMSLGVLTRLLVHFNGTLSGGHLTVTAPTIEVAYNGLVSTLSYSSQSSGI